MKNKILNIFLFDAIFVTAIVFSLMLNSCSCKPCQQQDESQIPVNVLRKSDQFIFSKTGSDFFKKYITIDFSQSKHIEPNYLMVYRFYMPEKPFVDELIRFTVDSTGKVLTQYEVVGIPDCNANEMDCGFVVDEKIAKQIAVQNGLAKGITDWKIDFIWNSSYNKYVWEIISTTKESKTDQYNRAEGEKIIIDSNNASVLSKDTWKIN
ncbi:MAG: hypothetical protein WAU11_09200 [Ignavibacteriaceae bacterium]